MDAVRVVTFTGGAAALLVAGYALRSSTSSTPVATRIPGPALTQPTLGAPPTTKTTEPAATPLSTDDATDNSSDEPHTCDCAHADDAGTTPLEKIALQRACEASTDDHCNEPWSVFAKLENAVVVRRSTGDCGGCGALTYATLFRGDDVVVTQELGRFGRFGNGPDAAAWMVLDRARVLVLDWSESMGGYSYDYRSHYFFENDELREGVCVVTAFSNTGGVLDDDDQLEWTTVLGRSAGGLDVTYRITRRGAKAPKRLPPLHLSARDARTTSTTCVQP